MAASRMAHAASRSAGAIRDAATHLPSSSPRHTTGPLSSVSYERLAHGLLGHCAFTPRASAKPKAFELLAESPHEVVSACTLDAIGAHVATEGMTLRGLLTDFKQACQVLDALAGLLRIMLVFTLPSLPGGQSCPLKRFNELVSHNLDDGQIGRLLFDLPICGVVEAWSSSSRVHISLPLKNVDDEVVSLLTADRQSPRWDEERAVAFREKINRLAAHPGPLDSNLSLTHSIMAQRVINEAALSAMALRATPTTVAPAKCVRSSLQRLLLPTEMAEVERRLADPEGDGIRSRLWQQRRSYLLVRIRCATSPPAPILARLPFELFQAAVKFVV